MLVSWYHFVPSSLWEPAKEEYKDQYVHKISELWSTDGVGVQENTIVCTIICGGSWAGKWLTHLCPSHRQQPSVSAHCEVQ